MLFKVQLYLCVHIDRHTEKPRANKQLLCCNSHNFYKESISNGRVRFRMILILYFFTLCCIVCIFSCDYALIIFTLRKKSKKIFWEQKVEFWGGMFSTISDFSIGLFFFILRMKINNIYKCTLNFKALYRCKERLESCFYVTVLNVHRYEYFRSKKHCKFSYLLTWSQ